jgi:hypothetical protein
MSSPPAAAAPVAPPATDSAGGAPAALTPARAVPPGAGDPSPPFEPPPSSPPSETPSAPAAQPEDRRSRVGSYLSGLLRGWSPSGVSGARGRAPSEAPRAADGPPPGPAADVAAAEAQAPPPPKEAAPWEPPASREEEERRIQAEVDRRAARAARQQADGARSTRAQQLQALAEEERRTRETDVYRAAELRTQLDAYQAQEAFVGDLVRAYDAVTVDPVVLALPEGERSAVLADVPPTLEGRKTVVEQTLQRLERLWRADERAKVTARLKQSSAFRKEVLTERQGLSSLEGGQDEPELVLGGTASRAPDPSAWFRYVLNR